MKLTKSIKLKHAKKRKVLGFKAYFTPLGYFKNRKSLATSMLGTGLIGSIDSVKFYGTDSGTK